MRTIIELVDAVHEQAIQQGMDVSPSDVGFIIARFFQGMAATGETPALNEHLLRIADECEQVKDE